MDPFKRKTIGKAFSATVDEINNGSAYRARGHGTQYNGEFPVKAKNGDVIQFKAFCDTVAIGPAGAGVVRWTRISAPPGAKISRLAIRAATLGKVR